MKNSIAERVYDFLKNYPPFNILKHEDLMVISKQVSIIYLEKGDTLFKKGDAFNEHFYMVRNGAITSFHTNTNNVQEIVNISDAGDIFGVRPLITKEKYKLTATANEESIVYAIPIDTFQLVTQNNASVYKFLITAFATNAYDPYTAEETGKIFVDYLPNTAQDMVYFQTANYTKNPITCEVNSTLKEAAIQMSTYKIGCIIVIDSNKNPLGIITNSDIKNKIATGKFPIETSVTNIMSSPVITSKKGLTVADGQLLMIKHNIGHL
ncbi:MAG TPA: cyclic nucleotide-binding domain-containing protein, partial [Mariniflexile sp.]|nr:cyclic nucleotide-binding domain-containing protein [Mariniflexile sp.]